ncbi:translation initiation factor IF-2-like [Onychomys torridus]|uniref:translation initiation factor IF-2-like n=1 Tax=Onychomys torridus TaxID=38674 RepID=UPI00167F590F|nr:translation initiation factor IF-2-like [Onychomys torridus]
MCSSSSSSRRRRRRLGAGLGGSPMPSRRGDRSPALSRAALRLLPKAGRRRRLAAAVFCATSSDFPTNALIVRTRVRAGFSAFYCVLLLIKKLSFAVAPERSPPELPSVPARTPSSRRGCRGQRARTRLLRSPRRPPPPAGLPPPPLPLAPTLWLQLRAPRLKNKLPRRRQLGALPPPGTPSGVGPVGPRSGAAAEGSAPRVGGRPYQGQTSCPGASRTPAPPGWAHALRSPRPVGLRLRPPGAIWTGEPKAQVEEYELEKIWRFCPRSLQTRSSSRRGAWQSKSRVAPTQRPNGIQGTLM